MNLLYIFYLFIYFFIFLSVKMWSVEYAQVPEEKDTIKKNLEAENTSSPAHKPTKTDSSPQTTNAPASSSTSSQPINIRKLSRHESCDSYASEDRSATDLLKDFKDPDFLAVRESELGSSSEMDSPFTQRLKHHDESLGSGSGGEYRMSTNSSFSDLGAAAEDMDSTSVKSGAASVDAGIDALAVFGDEGQGDRETENKGGSSQGEKSGPGTSAITVNPAASFKATDDVTAKYRPLSKHILREGR